ncbi:MAG: hypothetical protein PUP46_06315 [Endozoicomonas sp. (ex Botrylloides leachii)]|nr:hypothetical protein [Endozoicomonas sp. (ex Botrylloides leachii)]
MLSPDIDTTIDMLTEVYDDIRGVSDYANTCNSLIIGHVSSDPAWLASARSRVVGLRDVMNAFMQQKPDIMASIIVSFVNYQTLFAAFAAQHDDLSSADDWISMLESLKRVATTSMDTTSAANTQFSDAYKKVSDKVFLLDESIDEGWQALAGEESEMTRIAEAIGELSNAIASLGAQVTSANIRAEKTYIQSTVKMAYRVVMDSASSVPYLTIASCLLSIGEGVYNTLNEASDVQKQLGELTSLQNQATQAAQATAITKAVLQQLNALEKSFLQLNSTLPALVLIWHNEIDKLNAAINAINAGSSSSLLLDLQTADIAAASWQTITDFANLLHLSPQVGDHVLVDCKEQSITLINNE